MNTDTPFDPLAMHAAAALHAELAAQLAAGTLELDPADLQAFDLDPSTLTADDFALTSQIQTRYHVPLRSKPIHPRLICYEHAQQLAADLGPLAEPGARAHAVVSGQFIFGEFLEAWIKANNWLIPDLYCATLSLSGDNIDSLANLLHGDYVQRLHLTVSDYWYSHERGRNGLVGYAYQELDAPWRDGPDGDRFQLSVTGSHAKVTLLAPAEGGHYVLHGSANLRSSASIEQFALEHDPELYGFHLDWIQALESQYHTIRHTTTGRVAPKRQQWQAVQQAAARSKSPTTPDPEPRTNSAPQRQSGGLRLDGGRSERSKGQTCRATDAQ